jgi:dihydroorotate dehydrogenase (NAD+) catalytic subunit
MKAPLKIGSLSFRNRVLTASGTFGMGKEFSDFLDYSQLGGITLKTITKNPRQGNPPPRILETPYGLLNSIGLENEGFQKVYQDLKKNDYLRQYDTNVIFSLAGDSVEDYVEMARFFCEIEGIAMLELNLSCPNVHEGGATFDSNPENVKRIVEETAKTVSKPFTVKFSPSQDFVKNSRIAEYSGAHAITISNTFLGMAIHAKTKTFVFKNKTAGYSGPAVKPMALANVYRAAQAVKIPVIASGGISSAEDASEFLIAGASFISIGTLNFVDPGLAGKIAKEIE